MTGFNNNNKFIPQAQTYEVKYIENKELSKISKLTSYLGLSVAECSGKSDNSCKEVEKATSSSQQQNLYSKNDKEESLETLEKKTKAGDKAGDARTVGDSKSGKYYTESVSYEKKG